MAKVRWIALATLLLSLLAGPAAAGSGAAGSGAGGSEPAGSGAGGSGALLRGGTTVTLVTGDRVTVFPTAEGPQATVEPARWPGRRASFHVSYGGGAVRVLPSDVAPLVPGVLDPALFEVSALIRAGYDDAASAQLPLIVRPGAASTGTASTGGASLLPGLRPGLLPAGRDLPSIHANATALPKARAAELGERLTAAPALAGPAHIWLDGKASGAALDPNLTQIGAPAAWSAGLSGAGVRVAVLDSGVDATHPDLVGQVAAQANFTDSPVVTDRFGHGTHVASLVAGTGAAAGGARRGVAFGATLLSGKVLGDGGVGQFSWIIAGLEWAAGQRADVVNLSLGSDSPSTGLDPLSLAVDELTGSAGMLVVASAGNTGPAPTTIGAPGAADAALTVGAVDARDAVAGFSSRGPRLADHAIKPDLVAPGVDIVAARAAGTSLGHPVDSRYTRLSGTSMAAPQVAGAAALLAQQRPDWTPAMLKSVLVGTAAPTPGGVFDRGAGRLDLTQAIGQRLVAQAPNISYGLVSYPQCGLPPMTRPATVVNPTGTPRTVDLTAGLRDPAGGAAPAGMLTVTPNRLTIPAHGSAPAVVTLAVALGGAGAFSGEITATPVGGGPALRIPVGVVKESTRHVVRIHAVDRNGESNVETLVTLINLEDVTASPPDPVLLTGGEATVRVVPGFYTITAAVPTLGEGEPPPDLNRLTVITSVAIATVAEQKVDRDLDVELDARAAQPLSARVDGVPTVPADVRVFVAVKDRKGNGSVLGYATSAEDVRAGVLFVQPTAPAHHGRLELSSKWRLRTEDDGPTYDLLFAADRFPPAPQYVLDRRAAERLTTVDTDYRAPGVPVGYQELRQVFTDINPVSVAVAQTVPGLAPRSRVEYVSGGPGRQWFQCVSVRAGEEGIGDFCQPPTALPARSTVASGWLRAPLRTTVGAFQTATALGIGLDDLTDDGPDSGSLSSQVFARRTFELYRDGVLIAAGADPRGTHPVPAAPAVFRLVRTLELRPDLLPLSTVVESEWTFTSSAPGRRPESFTPPLVDVAVHVPVDDGNRVPAGRPLTIEVRTSQPADHAPRIAAVTLRVSTDDGATWASLALRPAGGDRWRAVIPAGALPSAGAVSVRASAVDVRGNAVTQTIIRAFLTSS